MRKYKIGITFNLEAKVTDIWANGAEPKCDSPLIICFNTPTL